VVLAWVCFNSKRMKEKEGGKERKKISGKNNLIRRKKEERDGWYVFAEINDPYLEKGEKK